MTNLEIADEITGPWKPTTMQEAEDLAKARKASGIYAKNTDGVEGVLFCLRIGQRLFAVMDPEETFGEDAVSRYQIDELSEPSFDDTLVDGSDGDSIQSIMDELTHRVG